MSGGENNHPRVTRREVLGNLISRFRKEALDSPQTDARLLFAHALGIDRLELLATLEATVEPMQLARVEAVALRRLAHEPVSRIVGERWFYGRPYRISPATLDPRPATETIIEAAKAVFAERHIEPRRILDIGTGTGCLLLTLLAEFPSARGIGSDLSHDALAVATANAAALGLADRAEFRCGPDFTPAEGVFDLVVSNPPYIPSATIPTLDPDVRDYDPLLALDGGPDGLEMYRRLAAAYRPYVPNGWLILEVGHDQAGDVANLFRSDGQDLDIRTFKDLSGTPRCVAVSPRGGDNQLNKRQ